MLVRLALETDEDDIVEMAAANMAESWPHLGFDEAVTRATFRSYLDTASPTIFVAEKRRAVVGFLLAGINEYRATAGHWTSQEVLYVRPEHRGTRAAVALMKHLIEWSRLIGAREIVGGNDNNLNSERIARFLEHFGFERVGHSMKRSV